MNTKRFLATAKLPFSDSEATLTFGSWRVLSLMPEVVVSPRVAVPNQIHGGTIVNADDLAHRTIAADGVVIETANTMAAVLTADCAAVVVMTDERALILHASRETLVRGLFDNALTYISPAAINRIYVGPHICEYHFGFKEEGALVKQFRYRYPDAVHFHKGVEYLSLRKALRSIFSEWNVHPERIVEDGRCTFEHSTLLSYRRELAAGNMLPPSVRMRTVVWRAA